MAIDRSKIESWFSPEAFPGSEHSSVANIRLDAKRLALTICSETPASADQSHAIRLLREAAQAAAQAVVLATKKP
jgi:hypothetical protein